MCWTCGCGELENDHHDHRHLVTADLQAAASASGESLPRAVGNIVMSLSHFDPDRVDAAGMAKEHDGGGAMDLLEKLEAEAREINGINTVEDFLAAVGHDPLTKEVTDTIEGRVCKADEEDQFLLMVAYSPNMMPLRGADKHIDVASPRVIEKGAWSFMAKGAKTGMWHSEGHGDEAICVENGIYRNPVPWDVYEDGTFLVKMGDWLVGFILSDYAWGLYKSGQIGGVSMQGGARRKPATAESLERIRSKA